MSNPFRRAGSYVDPENSNPTSPSPSHVPLSIDTTKSRSGKHVRIASPPDTAISPASYPASPVFTRLTTIPQSSPETHQTQSDNKASALSVDPFRADSSGEEDDEVIAEALRNARLNSEPTPPAAAARKDEASPNPVQNTLNKFASRPKEEIKQSHQSAILPQKPAASKQAMDVDAFTRMLLKGGASLPFPRDAASISTPSAPAHAVSESSSNADSASVSRQSIFEPMPPISAESPRTSHELDVEDAYSERRVVASGRSMDSNKKAPLAPKPRHGKPIAQSLQMAGGEPAQQNLPAATTPRPEVQEARSGLHIPLPSPPLETSTSEDTSVAAAANESATQTKRPPTPPLSRRRSQNKVPRPPLSRNSPSQQSLTPTSQTTPSSSSTSLAVRPAPPPSRRSDRGTDRKPSTDLPSTTEEQEVDPIDRFDSFAPNMPPAPLKRVSSSTTHASNAGLENPPPPPPPRRRRGLSRSSISSFEMARPLSETVQVGGINTDGRRPSTESGVSISGSSRDIMADLAALQREVDALRAQRKEL